MRPSSTRVSVLRFASAGSSVTDQCTDLQDDETGKNGYEGRPSGHRRGRPDVAEEASIEYSENGTSTVATYMATDHLRTIVFSWSLDGDDALDFSIDEGVIRFASTPDLATDMDGDNKYSAASKPLTRPAEWVRRR